MNLLRLFTWFVYPNLEGRSPDWEEARNRYLVLHPACEACGETDKRYVRVHHKKPFHLFPELELDETNFQTLCEYPSRNCHLNIGHSGDFKAYNPNSVEDAALMFVRRKQRKYRKDD